MRLYFSVKKLPTKKQNYWIFSSKNISGSAKKPDEKKSKEDEQTYADLSLGHHRFRAKYS